jgi:type I restriction enzyme R subunit
MVDGVAGDEEPAEREVLPLAAQPRPGEELGPPMGRPDESYATPRRPADRCFFGEYPPNFFDLVIVDECHRGGANDEGNWRGILEHFAPAVQLGLTATPKRQENADTYRYFGEPVFSYSLKDGINDGYLTPFKVRQITTTLDDYTYAPGDRVEAGQIEPGKRYTEREFNRTIEITARERKRVEIFLAQIAPDEKALVFCATQEHALLVRDLINQLKRSRDPNYCQRVTADDGELGEQHLRDFQDNEKTSPLVLTTSQKLSTGVDARNVRHIVLLRPVNSMIEFKQIIGRGTRLFEGKDYFTIHDFVRAHEHFNDPEWDGEPVEPEPKPPGPPGPPPPPPGPGPGPPPPRQKIKVKLADGKARAIQHMTVSTYWHPDGTPMTAQEFMALLFGRLPEFFTTEDELRAIWSAPDTRARLLAGLAERGFGRDQLAEMQKIADAENSDLFDVLALVAWAKPPVAREERAKLARGPMRGRFGEKQRAFLDFVLQHYVAVGVEELGQDKLTPLLRLRYGDSVADAIADLGPPESISAAFAGFQRHLYEAA